MRTPGIGSALRRSRTINIRSSSRIRQPALPRGVSACCGETRHRGGGGVFSPAAGVITALVRVAGRWTMVIANDNTVASGSWWPLTPEKIERAQEIVEAEKYLMRKVYYSPQYVWRLLRYASSRAEVGALVRKGWKFLVGRY